MGSWSWKSLEGRDKARDAPKMACTQSRFAQFDEWGVDIIRKYIKSKYPGDNELTTL